MHLSHEWPLPPHCARSLSDSDARPVGDARCIETAVGAQTAGTTESTRCLAYYDRTHYRVPGPSHQPKHTIHGGPDCACACNGGGPPSTLPLPTADAGPKWARPTSAWAGQKRFREIWARRLARGHSGAIGLRPFTGEARGSRMFTALFEWTHALSLVRLTWRQEACARR